MDTPDDVVHCDDPVVAETCFGGGDAVEEDGEVVRGVPVHADVADEPVCEFGGGRRGGCEVREVRCYVRVGGFIEGPDFREGRHFKKGSGCRLRDRGWKCDGVGNKVVVWAVVE